MSTKDLAPALPEKATTWFPGRRCSGLPSDTIPPWYKSEVLLSAITFTDTNVTPKPLGTSGTTAIFHDTACALFSAGGTTPSNQSALDALAKQIATDYFDYRSQSYDIVYNGVAAVPPNGLVDLLEVCYGPEDLTTRIQSQPFNGEPEELQHQDPAVSSCTDENNSRKPIAPVPCVYVYSSPETCTGGGGIGTPTIVGGVITSVAVAVGGTFTSTPAVAVSGDGHGAVITATLTGTAISSFAVSNGGIGYTYAIISTNGGGSKLQRCRFRLCIEDGRMASYFDRYETVG